MNDSPLPVSAGKQDFSSITQRILLVIHQELLRSALLKIIGENPRFQLLPVESAKEALEALRSESKPDVVIVEVNWQRSEDFELIDLVRRSGESPRVLAIAEPADAVTCSRVSAADVQGCVSKEDSVEILEEALAEVADGKNYFPAAFIENVRRLRDDPRAVSKILSEREQEVLSHVASGLTSRTIALRLNIGHRSVETYRYRLMKKLEVKNAAALVEFAVRNGFTHHHKG